MRKVVLCPSLTKRRMSSRVTTERIRELFHYEIVTGRFYRKSTGKQAAQSPHNQGYTQLNFDGLSMLTHRAAYLWLEGNFPTTIDHVNHDRACNSWHNIRQASYGENNANLRLRRDNSCGVKGVSFRKDTQKYTARVTAEGKSHRLGCFDTLEEASAAVRIARETLHGEFAKH